jgi:hypothetical protein
MSDDVNYLRLGELTIAEIASEFAKKCGEPAEPGSARKSPEEDLRPINNIAELLSSEARVVLGLVGTASLSLRIDDYRRLFPDIKWAAYLRRFFHSGLTRIPEAAATLTSELRAQAKAASAYYELFNDRLSRLAPEIAEGIDASAIARTMAESVRQAAEKELTDVRKLAVEVAGNLHPAVAHGAGGDGGNGR